MVVALRHHSFRHFRTDFILHVAVLKLRAHIQKLRPFGAGLGYRSNVFHAAIGLSLQVCHNGGETEYVANQPFQRSPLLLRVRADSHVFVPYRGQPKRGTTAAQLGNIQLLGHVHIDVDLGVELPLRVWRADEPAKVPHRRVQRSPCAAASTDALLGRSILLEACGTIARVRHVGARRRWGATRGGGYGVLRTPRLGLCPDPWHGLGRQDGQNHVPQALQCHRERRDAALFVRPWLYARSERAHVVSVGGDLSHCVERCLLSRCRVAVLPGRRLHWTAVVPLHLLGVSRDLRVHSNICRAPLQE
mmetsp:Transcript_51982/g.104262  ORF Transcript_51982/g.104262 Transcript_51982/m.104262 type:complete len:304 (+) Transcript_51982:464-1375(+)